MRKMLIYVRFPMCYDMLGIKDKKRHLATWALIQKDILF